MPGPEDMKGRIPPHSLEAEVSVLGAILLSDRAYDRAVEIIRSDDFYDPRHRLIFEAMISLVEDNRPIDRVSLAEMLISKEQLNQAGGGAYLAELTLAEPTAAHIAEHSRTIQKHSMSRALIERATQIVADGYEPGIDVDELVSRAEQSIFEVAEKRIRPSYFPLKEVVKTAFANIEALAKRKELITGVPTGYTELDQMTAGLQRSDLIIVAGRPSMGKTAFALNMALNASSQAGTGCLIFSLEMSKEQIATRLLGSEARVDAKGLRTGFIADRDWPKLIDSADKLSQASIFIDDTPGIDILELRAKARRLKREHDIGMIVVDYLQLMQGRVGLERREQEISDISRSLKATAKELDLPVIALSQLNRKVEDRPNKRPQMADLRESGAIEQDADVIMFIYRDEVYNPNPDNPNKGVAEIIIGKQRNGPTGRVQLQFQGRYTRFNNLDRTHQGFVPEG